MTPTDARADYLILIDFDGVLNMPRHPEDVERRLIAQGREPTTRDEFPWIKNAPADLTRMTFLGIGGAPVWGAIRTSVIAELRDIAKARGARIVWASSWLTEPERIREVSAATSLDFIEFPDLGDIVPQNVPLDRWMRHWKLDLAYRYVDTGARVLWIDDQLEKRPMRPHLERLDVIAPSLFFGLNPAHCELIRGWLHGNRLAVFDNHAFPGWRTTTGHNLSGGENS